LHQVAQKLMIMGLPLLLKVVELTLLPSSFFKVAAGILSPSPLNDERKNRELKIKRKDARFFMGVKCLSQIYQLSRHKYMKIFSSGAFNNFCPAHQFRTVLKLKKRVQLN
jgi:hypothetical protein